MSNLYDYSNVYIHAEWAITITGVEADDAVKQTDVKIKGIIFKYCTLLTDCISEINNNQIDNAKDIDAVMPVYNLIEYSDNYLKN